MHSLREQCTGLAVAGTGTTVRIGRLVAEEEVPVVNLHNSTMLFSTTILLQATILLYKSVWIFDWFGNIYRYHNKPTICWKHSQSVRIIQSWSLGSHGFTDASFNGNTVRTDIKNRRNALQNVDMTSVGTYDLLDSLKANLFYLESGGLNLNGHYLDADVVNTYSGTTLDASNAVIYSQELTLSGTVTGSTSTMIFMNRYNSVIIEPATFTVSHLLSSWNNNVSANTSLPQQFWYTWHQCCLYNRSEHNSMEPPTCILTILFDSLVVMNGGYVLTLDSGTTQTILSAIISYADCNNLVSIRSSKSGEQVTISKSNGICLPRIIFSWVIYSQQVEPHLPRITV